MKRFIVLFLLAVSLTACNSVVQLEDGKTYSCIGIYDALAADSTNREPNVHYRLSGWNVAMGIIFVELIVPPVVVLANQTFCPDRLKVLPAGVTRH